MMNFVYLLPLFFISCVSAGDVSINVCNKPLPPPAVPVPQNGAPQQAQEPQYRPTVDPNLCLDLDPACLEVFNLQEAVQTIPAQLDP
ncbi:unnamed protein product [Dracunculus medinensis]|uniref:CPCFC domain-containing protein n=1 Tax=Dracunculus medinensis TaxID=318479 RepID=A0A0N4URM5_DRAME|nr:unnamed protein product [Dracunculus medinensis]